MKNPANPTPIKHILFSERTLDLDIFVCSKLFTARLGNHIIPTPRQLEIYHRYLESLHPNKTYFYLVKKGCRPYSSVMNIILYYKPLTRLKRAK